MKKKVLFYGDFACATGFATVNHNIIDVLRSTGKYDFDIFAINYHGMPSKHQQLYNLFPAMDPSRNDPYGRSKFCNQAMQSEFDILAFTQDTFILDFLPELIPRLREQVKKGDRKPFRSILYFPTDSVIKPEWYRNISFIDKLVSYTEFGKEETLLAAEKLFGLLNDLQRKEINFKTKEDIEVIYHGINKDDFNVLPEEDVKRFRKQYFQSHSDKFIFSCVARNQQRKDLPRTIQAFKEFKKQVPDSILYLHCAKIDQGWNIEELCNNMGVSITEDVIVPQSMEPNQGFPIPILNMLYNCSDVIVSTTLGEGMGFSWLEGMSAKTPVLMPNNTAMKELITEEKGYLIDSGTNPSLWTCVPNDNNITRPLTSVEDMVQKMLYIYNNYSEAKQKAENAYKWIQEEMLWGGSIAKQWMKVFGDQVKELEEARAKEISQAENSINTESF